VESGNDPFAIANNNEDEAGSIVHGSSDDNNGNDLVASGERVTAEEAEAAIPGNDVFSAIENTESKNQSDKPDNEKSKIGSQERSAEVINMTPTIGEFTTIADRSAVQHDLSAHANVSASNGAIEGAGPGDLTKSKNGGSENTNPHNFDGQGKLGAQEGDLSDPEETKSISTPTHNETGNYNANGQSQSGLEGEGAYNDINSFNEENTNFFDTLANATAGESDNNSDRTAHDNSVKLENDGSGQNHTPSIESSKADDNSSDIKNESGASSIEMTPQSMWNHDQTIDSAGSNHAEIIVNKDLPANDASEAKNCPDAGADSEKQPEPHQKAAADDGEMNKSVSPKETSSQEPDPCKRTASPPLELVEESNLGGSTNETIGNDPAENDSSNTPSSETVGTPGNEQTEEEAEWISMGLGLGDALRQIVALTEERDAALALAQERESERMTQSALLVETQSRLEAEMSRREEFDAEKKKLKDTLQTYSKQLEKYETMEDELEKVQASLVVMVAEKSKFESEIQKLRELREESERREAVLSNRLNEAKKKEANKSTEAGRYEAVNEQLKEELDHTKEELDAVTKAKAKLESNMDKLKAKAVERVKQAETALAEERELNEERKKKMKVFVETKAEELREAKESANDMQKELQDTRAALRSSRDREEVVQKELESARIKYRELQRDMERMKKNSEQLHKMGSNFQQELEKSASETEEHKNKRMAAKHELMTMVRTLEVERAVSGKLRESIKFTFTPKALSQQQLLSECLRDFEAELERLAIKLGKTLRAPSESNNDKDGPSGGPVNNDGGESPNVMNGSAKKTKKNARASKADMDTERLISNLEHETQHVSKGIMSLVGSIERMRSLLDEDHAFSCMNYFAHFLAAQGEPKHQRLGSNPTDADDREETMSITSFEQGTTSR